MSARVTTISIAPVKGLALLHPDMVVVERGGARGDRAFFLVDPHGRMVSAPRLGNLLAVAARNDEDAGTLRLDFPDGTVIEEAVRLGAPEAVRFYDSERDARPVLGPFSAALSKHVGRLVRLVAPTEGAAVDRGADGAVTLLSLASRERLRRAAADVHEPVDARRFRMLLEVDGLGEHEEDTWLGRPVRAGESLLRVTGHVGRCVLTTRNPDSGAVDLPTLHLLRAYRSGLGSTEPLPFGVHAEVLDPGRVRVGDPVTPE